MLVELESELRRSRFSKRSFFSLPLRLADGEAGGCEASHLALLGDFGDGGLQLGRSLRSDRRSLTSSLDWAPVCGSGELQLPTGRVGESILTSVMVGEPTFRADTRGVGWKSFKDDFLDALSDPHDGVEAIESWSSWSELEFVFIISVLETKYAGLAMSVQMDLDRISVDCRRKWSSMPPPCHGR